MPTNLHGPHDNFDLTSSHVLPALMRKVYEARLEGRDESEVWGSGSARREFLHVDDLADACRFLMDHYSDATHVNIGTGVDVSIRELAETLVAAIHPTASIRWDRNKPDGAPRKLLDMSMLAGLGWTAPTSLEAGIASTFEWFAANYSGARGVRVPPDAGAR
jgi:GDP-L-fucose synthase